MKKIGSYFLQGLFAILPIVLSIYLVYWMAAKAESILGAFLQRLMPRFYISGMGIVAGFLIIVVVGILLKNWLFRTVLLKSERLIEKLPIVKFFYGSVRDLMGFFDTSKKKEFSKVVIVNMLDDARLIGLVTREDFTKLPSGLNDREDTIAVYLPMSYQMGGFTVFVPKSKVNPVDMTIEEAMRFALTAAVSVKKEPVEEHASST